MTVIRLPELYAAQREIALDPTRFRVICAGRRAGKTRLGAVLAFATAVRGERVAWLAPTYSQSCIGFEVCKALAAQVPGVSVRESTRTITFPSGGTIEFRSAEIIDNLRGNSWDLCIIDEAAYVPESLFDSVIRPALADRRGRMLAISTPAAVGDHFHEWFLRGQRNADPEWRSWQLPSKANPYLPSGEIDAARASMTSIAFQREFLAEFVTAAGARVQRAWLRIDSPPACTIVAQGVDLAISERASADYTAIVTVGRAEDGSVWILDAERVHAPFAGVLDFVKRKAGDWLPASIAIEDVQFQRGVITELLRTTQLPIRGVKPQGDKVARFAAALEARFESGAIRLAATLPGWFVDELCSFPVAKHDDGVDALVYAYAALGSQDQVISPRMVARASVADMPTRFDAYVGGFAIARMHDLSALAIVGTVEEHPDAAWLLAMMTTTRELRAQRRLLREARRGFRWDAICIDEGAAGPLEELIDRWADEAHVIDSTPDARADLADRLLRRMDAGKLRIAPKLADAETSAEILALQRRQTAAGAVVYDAGPGARLWALCLALKAADIPPLPRGMGQEPLSWGGWL